MGKKKKQTKRGKGYRPPEEIVPSRIKMPNRRMGEMFGRVVDIYGNILQQKNHPTHSCDRHGNIYSTEI